MARHTREYVLKQFWVSCVKDEFNLINLIQTEAGFSYAIAVMDRLGGWEEGNQQSNLGARLTASTWMYTEAVVCNGQMVMETFKINEMNSIIEAVVCADLQEDHD